VRFQGRPTDEPMRWMLVDSRAVRCIESEYMWFALIDLRAALEARTYEADGRVVLDVTDPFCPWNEGRWLLEVDGGRAACSPSDAAPDVSLPVSELAALYMGGRSALPMATASRIETAPDVALRLDALFRTRVPPWSLEHF
jgi:predicted acetyltransferase